MAALKKGQKDRKCYGTVQAHSLKSIVSSTLARLRGLASLSTRRLVQCVWVEPVSLERKNRKGIA